MGKEVNQYKTEVFIIVVTVFVSATLTTLDLTGTFPEQNRMYFQSLSAFILIGGAIISYFRIKNKNFEIKIEEQTNKAIENSERKFTNLFKSATITYQTKVVLYEKEYVIAIQNLIKNFKKDHLVGHIYAIDYTNPIDWWNESMTAYLAIFTKWKSENNKHRKVHRIFVLEEYDFDSELMKRTLLFHSLLGLNTYVYSYNYFTKLFKEFFQQKGITNINPRELVIWENSTTQMDSNYTDVMGYQSYWKIDEGRTDMLKVKNKSSDENIKDMTGEDIPKPNILFEPLDLIDLENKDKVKKTDLYHRLPNLYIEFIKMLINPNNILIYNDLCLSKENNLENKELERISNQTKPFGIMFGFDYPTVVYLDSILKLYKTKSC